MRFKSTITTRLSGVEVRDSGAGDGQFTMRGHASMFDRLSLDLGGFREVIAPGAFTNVLNRTPDVHLVWDHDTSLTLARTKNKTLELREDPIGLHVWARIAPTSYAADLRVLMDRGDIDQMSFAFTVGREEWTEDPDGNVTARVLEVDQLYDVTVCAQGAYPQTDASVVRSRLQHAIDLGAVRAGKTEVIAPETVGGGHIAPTAGEHTQRAARLAAARARARVALTKR